MQKDSQILQKQPDSDMWTSLVEDFRAKTSVLPENVKVFKGKRSGLWSEMYRIIWEVRPKYVIIENSPALTISGLEQVLCDLSKIRYNAEWQCISNYAFGYPHKRERLYLIAYSNKIGLQGDVCKCGSINSIFKQWTSDTSVGYTCAKRILEIPAHSTIRNDDGFPDWSHRVGSIGNAVNPTVAKYLFECIKIFDKQLA